MLPTWFTELINRFLFGGSFSLSERSEEHAFLKGLSTYLRAKL